MLCAIAAECIFSHTFYYTNLKGVDTMAKKGMKRPEITKKKSKNDVPPVPEIQGKAKRTEQKADPV